MNHYYVYPCVDVFDGETVIRQPKEAIRPMLMFSEMYFFWYSCPMGTPQDRYCLTKEAV
jgi:hypothetical protein